MHESVLWQGALEAFQSLGINARWTKRDNSMGAIGDNRVLFFYHWGAEEKIHTHVRTYARAYVGTYAHAQ